MNSYPMSGAIGGVRLAGNGFQGNGNPEVPPPLVTTSRLIDALKCRRGVWITTTLIGLLAAVALSAGYPPDYTATSIVLVRHDSSRSNPASAMQTDVELVTSRAVAQRAVTRAALDISANALRSAYGARPLSNDLLGIAVRGPTAGQARRRAEAISDAFLGLRREVVERNADVAVAALQQRRAEVTADITGVNAQIAEALARTAGNPSAPPTPGLTELLARRAGLDAQEVELRRRMDDAIFSARLLVNDTGVIDTAAVERKSLLRALTANVAAGIVGGLVAGIGWVLAQEVLSPQVRRRGDVMSTLNAPVITLGRLRRVPLARRRILGRNIVGERDSELRFASGRRLRRFVSHLRTLLEAGGRDDGRLIVIAIGSEPEAGLGVAATAAQLVAGGEEVLLADISQGLAAAAVFGVHDGKVDVVHAPSTGGRLVVSAITPATSTMLAGSKAELREARERADVVLTLATMDPALEPPGLADWGMGAVVVVTAGRTTAATLRWTAQRLRDSGIRLYGAILLGASTRDDTLPVVPSASITGAPSIRL